MDVENNGVPDEGGAASSCTGSAGQTRLCESCRQRVPTEQAVWVRQLLYPYEWGEWMAFYLCQECAQREGVE